MATIKPIEGRTVHQIQSGQVIVDLCSVAKELVENSLDAGATTIEVRFKNNGLDSIEVQDNGAGIGPDDYETIALKHYTSKLSSYDDLDSLQTFGFRGEALSSLCALSRFHIVTARASNAPKGTKLEFETSGKLKGTSVVASQRGTTVVVENLFYNLPVRRKELEKTVKREYQKVLGFLHAYACISTGVKFTVSNQMPKGKKTVAFTTNANPNTKENIANVYGAKTLLALIPLDLKFELDPTARSTQSARNWSTQQDLGAREVRIVGHISRPVVGEGRQTPDRQMFFVNSRPCGLPQVAKAFNEVYKSYNVTQSPFIFADIKLDTNAYDVNVSPDKRTILLHDQGALLDSLKQALIDLFEAHDQSVPHSQLAGQRLPSYKPLTIRRESTQQTAEKEADIVGESRPTKRKLSPTQIQPPLSPREAAQGDTSSTNLISRFAGRNTEERFASTRSATSRKTPSPAEPAVPEAVVTQADNEPEEEGLFMSSRSPSPAPEPEKLPKPVQDFNTRLLSQQNRQRSRRASDSPPAEDEPSIPKITQTPQSKSSQSTIQNAFDRMRPMRTPLQQATITVGDTTTVSTIGSASRASKKARIHFPKFGFNGTPLSQTTKKPFLLKSLRGFVAPGTQVKSDDEEDEMGSEADEVEEPDSSMPDASVGLTPPLPKKQTIPPTEDSEGSESGDEVEPGLDNEAIPPSLTRSAERVEELSDGDQDMEEQLEKDEEMVDVPEEPHGTDASADEYIDESEKKAREEAKVAKMIAVAEETAARPSEDNIKRANRVLKSTGKKYSTIDLVRFTETSVDAIRRQQQALQTSLEPLETLSTEEDENTTNAQLSTTTPEERLSLTVTKSDFLSMRIIGQFNLGFILAVRPPTPTSPSEDLFIIDQHASDEKYNFERLSATSNIVPQRLVHPHALELTAIEEEIILNFGEMLVKNGFVVSVDMSGNAPVGKRARLLSLPMSREVTFTPEDLEELLVLLSETSTTTTTGVGAEESTTAPMHPTANSPQTLDPESNSQKTLNPNTTRTPPIVRPTKIRRLLASRACRSSIMIGKTLTVAQMHKVVRHMGEMDKPWSCPHGRPTMRHLFALSGWRGWSEGDGVVGLGMEMGEDQGREDERGNGTDRSDWTDWRGYFRGKGGRR